MKILKVLPLTVAALLGLALPAIAQESGSSSAPLPSSTSSPIRLMPVAGASSFSTSSSSALNKYNQGFSAGLLADFGTGYLTFESGVLTLSSQAQRVDNQASVTVNSWGIPLLAKINFSGKPNSTIFAKAGAMPFTLTGSGTNSEFNWLGVAGVGANIPLGRSASILLDASYNHILNNSAQLSRDYQGVSLLAGLSFSI